MGEDYSTCVLEQREWECFDVDVPDGSMLHFLEALQPMVGSKLCRSLLDVGCHSALTQQGMTLFARLFPNLEGFFLREFLPGALLVAAQMLPHLRFLDTHFSTLEHVAELVDACLAAQAVRAQSSGNVLWIIIQDENYLMIELCDMPYVRSVMHGIPQLWKRVCRREYALKFACLL